MLLALEITNMSIVSNFSSQTSRDAPGCRTKKSIILIPDRRNFCTLQRDPVVTANNHGPATEALGTLPPEILRGCKPSWTISFCQLEDSEILLSTVRAEIF